MPCASIESSDPREFGKDLGLVHELVVTGREAGWKREDYAKLVHDKALMKRFLLILRSHGKIVADHVIETDLLPPVDVGHRITCHEGYGPIEFHSISSFYRVLNLGNSRAQTGHEMQNRIFRKIKAEGIRAHKLANATFLRYLIENQKLIKEARLYHGCCFFGTVFADPSEREYVEMIDGFEGRYTISKFYLDSFWSEGHTSIEF